jgi:hypothetical protein
MSHLAALRAVHRLALSVRHDHPVDADLREEAGMDGNLARLLQSARDLDREAAETRTNFPPGSMLSGGVGPTGRWFDFTLGFADDGPDLDTITSTLRAMLPDGDPNGAAWVVHVEPAVGDALDVVPSHFEQDDDPEQGWPVYLVGHRYDDNHTADNDFRGEPVRILLTGARVTVY